MKNAIISFDISAMSIDDLGEVLRAAVDRLVDGGCIDFKGHVGMQDGDDSSYLYKVEEYSETDDGEEEADDSEEESDDKDQAHERIYTDIVPVTVTYS